MKPRLILSGRQRQGLSEAEIYAFLPAALELERRPPSPLGRGLMWTLMVIFTLILLWAWWGRLDIYAQAPGQIRVSQGVQQIQSLVSAKVVEIGVKEGQQVQAGQLLLQLDSDELVLEQQRLALLWQQAYLEQARQQAWVNWLSQGAAIELQHWHWPGIPVGLQGPSLVQQQQHYYQLVQQRQGYEATLARHQQEALRLQGQYQQELLEQQRYRRLLELVNEQVAAYQKLQQQQLAARSQWLQARQQQVELEQGLAASATRLQQLQAAQAANEAGRQALIHEQRSQALAKLQQSSTEYQSLQRQWQQLQQRLAHYRLVAPLAGTVQNLQVFTLGGVVSPAQVLLEIVPQAAELEAQVWIRNQDRGFVSEGQSVKLKVDSYNFTKYGLVEAQVQSIAQDASEDERYGLVYPARIQLLQTGINADQQWLPLAAGMSLSAEIHLGQRRVIEYFLSPLLKYRQDSLHER
ncbi:HlyD family type I secretion periplasmic adaptor subunit [Balneatrix alpica]|uniref:HlyD family type I secretion periplasmic adaptor subunit n=1 Tax=Balneatrix alpica TaxID=75684 RepID=UPI0027390811|nr:HlyD family type I secretion periplasmic adaptor subunit [Balneatrix alpica]